MSGGCGSSNVSTNSIKFAILQQYHGIFLDWVDFFNSCLFSFSQDICVYKIYRWWRWVLWQMGQSCSPTVNFPISYSQRKILSSTNLANVFNVYSCWSKWWSYASSSKWTVCTQKTASKNRWSSAISPSPNISIVSQGKSVSVTTGELCDFGLDINFHRSLGISLSSVSQSTIFTVTDSVDFRVGCEEGKMVRACCDMSDVWEAFDNARCEEVIIESSAPAISGLAPGKESAAGGEGSPEDLREHWCL